MEVTTENAPEASQEACQQITKLGICEVCTVHPAKYTCPRCEVKTCCLRCSSIHKRELQCDGTRDRTKFIRLEKFSNLDMSSDYQLLEEISRSVASYKKGLKKKHPGDYILPSNLFRLQKSAKIQNIYLKYLPYTFQRRKNNKTRLNYKENLIYWTIEFVFVNAECLRVREVLAVETADIKSILENCFSHPEYSENLQEYSKVGLSGASYFLKAEEISGNKFYAIDIYKSISSNLRGKVIIEYPIIHVVMNEFAASLDVIKQEFVEDETPAIKLAAAESELVNNDPDDIYTCMKNLLFINDDV